MSSVPDTVQGYQVLGKHKNLSRLLLHKVQAALSHELFHLLPFGINHVASVAWVDSTYTVEYKSTPMIAQAGKHIVEVEWRKWGSNVRAWRNSPSFLDGFAMSRFVAAMGERLEMVSQHILAPVVLRDPLAQWQTVGGRQLDFHLHGPATVLFTYGLPVTQASHETTKLKLVRRR